MVRQYMIQEDRKIRLLMSTYGCISIVYGQLKDMVNAEKYLQKARDLFASQSYFSSELYMNLFEALFAFNNGNYEQAELYLKQPDNIDFVACQYYLAEIYRILGEEEQAKHYFELTSKSKHPWWAALYYAKCMKRLAELDKS